MKVLMPIIKKAFERKLGIVFGIDDLSGSLDPVQSDMGAELEHVED